MTSPPKITVVIPHFNRAALLAQTLESIRRQSFDDWEVIVVDDGSEADELSAIRTMEDRRVIVMERTEEPKGPSASRNTGLRRARGEFVMFVDSDDLLAPWCLQNRIETAESHPEKSFWVFPVMLFHQHMGDQTTLWNNMTGSGDLNRFLHSDPPWHTSSPLWKRCELQNLGGFNDSVMYGDDSDLHMRALLDGMPYIKLPDALPDAFVRRDDTPRITNSLSESLLQSRRIRLTEGSATLKTAAARNRLAWEGQYFAEAEFLLFNVNPPGPPMRVLMSTWAQHHRPNLPRWWGVHLYLCIAMLTRKHAYLVLRIARRVAKLFLPVDYFPSAMTFQNVSVPENAAQKLRERIANRDTSSKGGVDASVST